MRQIILDTNYFKHINAVQTRSHRNIGNESAPIQMAQCRFLGLAISDAKILNINIFFK